jgi:hypothetical protein
MAGPGRPSGVAATGSSIPTMTAGRPTARNRRSGRVGKGMALAGGGWSTRVFNLGSSSWIVLVAGLTNADNPSTPSHPRRRWRLPGRWPWSSRATTSAAPGGECLRSSARVPSPGGIGKTGQAGLSTRWGRAWGVAATRKGASNVWVAQVSTTEMGPSRASFGKKR